MTRPAPRLGGVLNRVVIVSALGYFVDIYDLLLFSIIRRPSLIALGITDENQLLDVGIFLLNWQMGGLLVGGILWGILGDKRGRLSVLFGSIALYSVANIANAFVTTIPVYAALRFVAGVGLAGELGAAITLVSEVLPKEARGYGTAIVASVGILGAVVAGLVGKEFQWQVAFLVGGVLGLVLLVARLSLVESGMYSSLKGQGVRRGDLLLLLGSKDRALKYLNSILIGLPIWFIIGILITLSPEIAVDLRITGRIDAGTAVIFCYAGASVGDLASGFLSQWFRSRWRVVLAFITGAAVMVFTYYFARGIAPSAFYAECFLLGLFAGYWAVFVTMAAEQFGTNLRSTVATTVPNMIRGTVVPLTLAFQALIPAFGRARSALLVGAFCFLVSLAALRRLKETYGKDLDYLEHPAAVAAATQGPSSRVSA